MIKINKSILELLTKVREPLCPYLVHDLSQRPLSSDDTWSIDLPVPIKIKNETVTTVKMNLLRFKEMELDKPSDLAWVKLQKEMTDTLIEHCRVPEEYLNLDTDSCSTATNETPTLTLETLKEMKKAIGEPYLKHDPALDIPDSEIFLCIQEKDRRLRCDKNAFDLLYDLAQRFRLEGKEAVAHDIDMLTKKKLEKLRILDIQKLEEINKEHWKYIDRRPFELPEIKDRPLFLGLLAD